MLTFYFFQNEISAQSVIPYKEYHTDEYQIY